VAARDDDAPRQRVSREKYIAAAKRGQVNPEILEQFMPTYRLHVYYDTGERLDGRPVLRPQTYFGYYVEHEGPLTGWKQALDAPPSAQLQELAPEFYKMLVPTDGVEKLTTTIEAVETDQPGGGHGGDFMEWFRSLPRWLQILLLVILFLLILWLFV
jgi:hypothetical protein